MACSDGIEVVSLNHVKVFLHLLQAYCKACYGVGIVTVNASELNLLSVEINDFILYLYLSDTNLIYDYLVFGFHNQSVEVRLFGIPKCGIYYFKSKHLLICTAVINLFVSFSYEVIFFIVESNAQGSDFLIKEIHFDFHICFVFVYLCFHKVIENCFLGSSEKINISEDTALSELILVFKVSTVTPLKNQNRQLVCTLYKRICNLKLACRM